MSLRVRLVVGLVALAALGLAAVSAVTYLALQAHLLARADRQLDLIAGPVGTGLADVPFEGLLVGDRVQEAATRVAYPPGTYGEIRGPDGGLQVGAAVADVDGAALLPELPRALPGSGGGSEVQYLTVDTKTRPFPMRVRAEALAEGGTLVVAVPFDDEEATLEQLLRVELLVSSLVVIAIGMGGLLHVQRSLRPLRTVAGTAEAIAAGDHGQRIVEHHARSEVGRMERALNTMLDELASALAEQRASEDRLRRFIADASHELRTPLTSIRGYAELFRLGAMAEPDDLATAMRRIEEESRRMAEMVEDLLLLARLDEGPALQRAPVDLAALARDAVADTRASQPQRQLDVGGVETAIAEGDEAQLRQVLANLLTNALVHTPPEARVTVRVDVADSNVVVEVADEGPGLEPAQAARVFERFNRGEPGRVRHQGAGTGLGLAIVQAIVEAHGGEVRLETTPGEGCTFRVRLPAARPHKAAQWDEKRGCWVIWDKHRNDWVPYS